jgi:tRNA 2-thiouridine synthesizing protein A
MEIGQVAEVRLNDGEPLHNVPRSVKEHGHEVLALDEESGRPGVWRLRLKKTR